MDLSNNRDEPAVPFTTSSSAPLSHRLSLNPQIMSSSTTVAAPVPSPSPSSSSLLSPSDATPRPASKNQQHPAPRRTSSSGSLRDDGRRKSTPSLQKRSSTASLRSVRNSAGSSPSLSRRSSTSFTTSPPTTNSMTKIMPTATSIAAEYFQKDIDSHQATDLQSKTLVVVHDACYGHRFARPRTSRATLGSIVERPERIRAGVLGVSAAYVRLGRRYAGERYAPHPCLDPRTLSAPPFQIRKTSRSLALADPAVAHVHGNKWMEDLKTMCDAAESRLALNGKELVRPRSTGKDGHAPEFHQGDLYLCSESLGAFQGALGGVCDGIDAVLGPSSTKRAFVCIRPPGHHCSPGHPSGFCWINNVHVGISYAAMMHGLTHAAILDFDLHHGDGSQEIAWAQNSRAATAPKNAAGYKKTRIGYFSLHDINSYPCEMGDFEKVRNASVCIDKGHNQSIWNVHLVPWKKESEFWELYATKYTVLLQKARDFLRLHTERLASIPNGPPPKAAIFLSAGFDASEWEGVGMQRHKVNVPTDFYAKFTADVARMAEEEGLGADGRVISVLEGGYSDRALMSGVFSHLSGLSDATPGIGFEDQNVDRLATKMTHRLGIHDAPSPTELQGDAPETGPDFDSTWWSSRMLEELEALVYPPPPVPKGREKPIPTYLTTTQSFTAKVVSSARDRVSRGSRPSSELDLPQLPEVGWATATHELSKILIPSGRQTTSCRPEDLNAEASRVRRDRQAAADGIETVKPAKPAKPAATATAPEANRMQLRERKPKLSTPKTERSPNPRRTTIDPATDLTPSWDKSPGNRRKSAAASTPMPGTDVRSDRSPSRATTGYSRPGTAASNRFAASMASRKPSTSRSGTPKCPGSPKNVPPVPRVPFGLLSTASRGEEASTVSDPHTTPMSAENSPPDDVDSLAAGVRKLNIKLKVPSPEENAAREKKAAKEREKASKASKSQRSSTTGFKHLHSSPTSGTQSSFSKSAPPASGPPVTAPAPAPESNDDPEPSSPALAAIPNTVTIGRPGTSRKTSALSSSIVSPTLTPGTTREAFHPQAFAAQSKHGLPTFTSTDAIPFASTDGGNPTPTASRPSTSFSHANSNSDQSNASASVSGSWGYDEKYQS